MDGRDYVSLDGMNREPYDSRNWIFGSDDPDPNSLGHKLRNEALNQLIGADQAEVKLPLRNYQALMEIYGLRGYTSPEACPAGIGSLERFSGCVRSFWNRPRSLPPRGSPGRPNSPPCVAGVVLGSFACGRQWLGMVGGAPLHVVSRVEAFNSLGKLFPPISLETRGF